MGNLVIHRVLRGLVMSVLLLSALPTLDRPANPQHVDQARAFAAGSLWISSPTTTHDLGRVGDGWFAPFPPLPALLALPAVLVGVDPHLALNMMAVVAAMLSVWLAARLGTRWGGAATGTWAAAALGLGSGLWVATAVHDTYHSAHVLAVTLLMLALERASSTEAHGVATGLAVGAAALARQATLLAAPAVAAVHLLGGRRRWRRDRWRPLLVVIGSAALPLLLYLALNQLRFGSPLSTGYDGLAHHPRLAADVAAHGAFSPHYLPQQVATLMGGLPRRVPVFPWLVPDPHGMAVWLVAPWLVCAVWPLLRPDRPRARRLAVACWAGAALVAVPHLLYVNTGWVQFGYRFALDWTPLLLLAAVLGVRRGPRPWAVGLLAAAIAVNAWGWLALVTWERWSPYLG